MYTVHPISAMLKESHFYRYNKFEIESPFYKEDEGFGWWKLLDDTPYTTGEEKLAGWNSADDAKKGREKIASVEERVAEEESKEEEEESEEEEEEELDCCVSCDRQFDMRKMLNDADNALMWEKYTSCDDAEGDLCGICLANWARLDLQKEESKGQ